MGGMTGVVSTPGSSASLRQRMPERHDLSAARGGPSAVGRDLNNPALDAGSAGPSVRRPSWRSAARTVRALLIGRSCRGRRYPICGGGQPEPSSRFGEGCCLEPDPRCGFSTLCRCRRNRGAADAGPRPTLIVGGDHDLVTHDDYSRKMARC